MYGDLVVEEVAPGRERLCLKLLEWSIENQCRALYKKAMSGVIPCPLLNTCEKGRKAVGEGKSMLHDQPRQRVFPGF